MSKIHQILQKYWGYKEFRSLQEDIINSILSGNDTLALLPTGGGKSICFQVPAMVLPGVCIVISPLIALMKDQVFHLQKKGIKAVCIVSGMDQREIDIILDNCVYGDIKFLYISPERIQTRIFIERVKKMKVSFVAVDEAHCISQWGYDFRPPYLQIADLRTYLNNKAIIALTATATPQVVDDIQEKLKFKKNNVFQKSFSRSNLAYHVRKEEDKLGRLLRICTRLRGTGLVYVRSRKKTVEIAQFLIRNKISADFYHAGLDQKIREKKQEKWINNKTRIIVSTNAFGMGIDKSDVRFVVHLDIPESPEAYFQEAGRAGRDEKNAWAVILYNQIDLDSLEKNLEQTYPEPEIIKKIYMSLANYSKLAEGSVLEEGIPFQLSLFCKNFNLNSTLVFNSIRLLESAGLVQLSDSFYTPSQLQLSVNQTELYHYQISHPTLDAFIKLLLRSYGGLFDELVKINEAELSKRINLSEDEIKCFLRKMEADQILIYIEQSNQPKLSFPIARVSEKNFSLPAQVYLFRKNNASERIHAMFNYVSDQHHCRSLILLKYFGENTGYRCGICDYCLKENHLQLSNIEIESISTEIKKLVKGQNIDLKSLKNKLIHYNEEKVKTILRWLLDNDQLKMGDGNYLKWKD